MSISAIKTRIPDRAIASVVFGCFYILVHRIFVQLEWMPMMSSGAFSDKLTPYYIPIMVSVQNASRALAVAALVWCIWSWLTERRLPAIVATLFTALVWFDMIFTK